MRKYTLLIIFIIFILVDVGILFYTQYQQKQQNTTRSTVPQSSAIPTTAINFIIQPLITSDIKTVQVKQMNSENLQKSLEAMGFFTSYTPNNNATQYPTLAPGTVLHLQINFSDIVQPVSQVTVAGKNNPSGQPIVYPTYDYSYDPNSTTLKVNVYQHPDNIAAIEVDTLGKLFWQQTLMALWTISHTSQVPSNPQDYQKIILNMQEIAKNYPVVILTKTQ